MGPKRRTFGLGSAALMIAALLVPVLAGAAPAATAGDRVGVYDPATAIWSLDGLPDFLYGNPGDHPLMGDWNCDGVDTPGLYRRVDSADGPAGKVYLRNSNTTGIADIEYFFGNPGDLAVAGDFNGNGCDTVSLFRPSTGEIFVTNLLGSRNRGLGTAEITTSFDAQGHDISKARPFAGDFGGNGVDSVALHIADTATVLGVRAQPFTYGNPGDQLVAGAWSGSADAVGVYRAAEGKFLLSATATDSIATGSLSVKGGDRAMALSWSESGAAREVLMCDNLIVTHPGTPGNDVINGTNGDDVIAGLGGNDVIGGKGGNDTICAGDGADVVDGDAGNDRIFGENGDDNLNGKDGDDFIDGGAGADIISGDKNNDTMYGGDGPDNMNGDAGNDFLDGEAGDDLMNGGTGNDTLLGRDGADVLNGGPQFDTCDLGTDGLLSKSKCENERPQAVDQSENVQEDGPAITEAFDTTDPDGDPTTYVVKTGPTPNKGMLTNNGDGTFTYDPNGDFESLALGEMAVVTFTYIATDSHGAASDVATVTITVHGNNDDPTAVDDDGGATDEDTATFTGDVLANDTDPDASDMLFVSAFDASSFNLVPITYNGNGTFGYDPAGVLDPLDAGDILTDTFDYTVSDGNGGTDSATVTVTVTGVDDPPFAGDDTASTNEDTAITISVLGNDGDLDADDTVSVSAPVNGATGFSSAAGAAMENNGDNTFDYDPTTAFDYLAVGESAADTFTYEITSTGGGTATAAVEITVEGRNDAPTADDQTVAGTGTFVITLTGDDVDLSDDLDFSTEFALLPATTTAGGTLDNLVNTDGVCSPVPCSAPDKNSATVEYTVPSGGPAPDSFTFTVDDNNGGTATATVTINPDPAGDPTDPPPDITGIVAKDVNVEVVAGTPKEIVIQAAAPATIDDLTFSVVAGPGQGAITSGPTDITPNDPSDPVRSAKVTYDPQSFTGPTTSFTFEACEVAVPANCDSAVVSITVAAAAPPTPPPAGPLTGSVSPDSSATIDLALGVGQSEGEDDGLPKGRSHTGSDPDVYFLVDVTGSMSDDLSDIEDDIMAVIADVQAVWPNAHFGLGTYDDIDTDLNPLPGPFPTLFDNLVTLKPDDGASGGTSGDVSDEIGAAGQQLANSFFGDTPEAQFFALDRLASTANPAGFDSDTPSVIVYIGDAPAHDPVCEAVHGVSGLGNITETSVISALTDGDGPAIAVVANSIDGAGLDADPNAFPPNDYNDGTAPDCTPVGGSAGQATRLSGLTGGSFHVDASASTLAAAVLAAIDGTPPDLTYSVTLPVDFAGTLTDSTGAAIPVGVVYALPSPKVFYGSAGIPLGTLTGFTYTVTSTVTTLSTTSDVFITVREVGSCETSASFCDDGRP